MLSARPIRTRAGSGRWRSSARRCSGRATICSVCVPDVTVRRSESHHEVSTGYTGFVRAPLIRYGQDFALSNTWLEHGVDIVAGSPRLFLESSLGVPGDEGGLRRRRGLDRSIRVQGYYKALIVGASRLYSGRDRALGDFAHGESLFNGVDGRFTTAGSSSVANGFSDGRSTGSTTTGGYLDLLVHRRALGIVTPVARIERLDYEAGPYFSLYLRRVTGGARIDMPGCFTGQINVIHQPAGLAAGRRNVMDAGITCSVRR